jgi:hypothetical protein
MAGRKSESTPPPADHPTTGLGRRVGIGVENTRAGHRVGKEAMDRARREVAPLSASTSRLPDSPGADPEPAP